MKFTQTVIIYCTSILLIACGSTPEKAALSPEQTDAQSAPIKNIIVPSKPFEADTLYELLIAEFALQRAHYDIALGNYLLQAHKTKDAGVAERATYIAQYLSADQAAMDAATLWVNIDNNNIQAHQAVARELVLSKQISKALPHIEAIERLGGHPNYYLAVLDAKTFSQDDIQTLLIDFQALSTRHPDNSQILLAVAYLHNLLKDQSKALSIVNTILNKDNTFVSAILLKAQILAEQKDRQAAIMFLQTILAKHTFDASSEQNISKLYLVLLLQAPTDSQAPTFITDTTAKFSNDTTYLLTIAQICAENDAYTEAHALFSDLISHPNYASISHFYLGLILEKQNQNTEAITHYIQVNDDKNIVSAYSRALNLYIKHKQNAEALTLLTYGRAHYPKFDVEFALLTFDLFKTLNKPKNAFDTLDKAIIQHPDFDDLRYTRAMYAVDHKKINLAEADLTYILNKDPNNAAALNALGYTLADQTQRIEEAKIFVEKAYAIKPDDPAIIDSLGWIYFKLGDIDKALILLTVAYEQYPDPEIGAHLVEVYWVKSETNKAKTLYQTLIETYPTHHLIQALPQRLNGLTE